MANRIEWFLVEVERRIEGKLSPRRVQSVSDELRDHLEASRDEFVQLGLDPQVAEGKAVATFGRPEKLSEELLEPTIANTFGVNTEMLIKLIGIVACVAFPFITFGQYEAFSIEYAAGVAAVFALLFVFLFTRVNKLQTATILTFSVAIVVILGAAFAQLTIYEPNTGLHRTKDLPKTATEFRTWANTYAELEKVYTAGTNAFATEGPITDKRFYEPGKGYLVPPPMFTVRVGSYEPVLDHETDLAVAKKLWSKRGEEYSASARDGRDSYSRGAAAVASLVKTRPGDFERFVSFMPGMGGFAAIISLSLLGLNGIAMTLGKAVRRRPLRRTLA